jgi:heptosyltransferase III
MARQPVSSPVSLPWEELAREAESRARERYRSGCRRRCWDLLPGVAGFLRRWVLRLGVLHGKQGLRDSWLGARADAEEARWLERLEHEIGGAAPRGPFAEALRLAGRRLVVAGASLLLPRPSTEALPLTSIRKVLVIRTDERVGNQLLTTPLLRALKLGLPQARLDLLANARKSVVIESRHVDRIIPFEKRLAFRRPWSLLAQLLRLRRERYDLVVEAAHWSGASLTAILLARLIHGRMIVGHERQNSDRFLSHPVRHDPANEVEVPAKLELLRPLGLLPRGLEPETELGADTAPARALVSSLGLPQGFALLNPGARLADRRWPPASYAAVARGLAARGLAVLVAWGPGEEPLARAIAQDSGARLAPATDLPMLAGLLRLARLCVSNNTGPMHLAVAVGTPTVGVFLSDDATRWRHLLPIFEVAQPAGDQDADAVLAACDRLLRRTATASPSRPRAG